jgi:hypothetical protein
MVMTEEESYSVDTEEDRKNVEEKMSADILMRQYIMLAEKIQ